MFSYCCKNFIEVHENYDITRSNNCDNIMDIVNKNENMDDKNGVNDVDNEVMIIKTTLIIMMIMQVITTVIIMIIIILPIMIIIMTIMI